MRDAAAGPRVSVAVMYHPDRADRIPRLAEACRPLRPVPVPDPDPGSFPSPLRTAKRAWQAYDPAATHHLVLQDDVLPVPGFAGHLLAAVDARPDDVLALYTHWNSPYNSYAVRQAAAAGAAWARLVPGEWAPAQGLLLPVKLAADLAGYLAAVPDEVRDDDTVIELFLREHDRCVLATVPHLLDHDETGSVAGNDAHGVRRATVFLPGAELRPERWRAAPPADKGAVMRAAGASGWDFSVTFAFSTCFVGFLRPAGGECVRHPFGRWSDWCGVLGLTRQEVLGGPDRPAAPVLDPAAVAESRAAVELRAAAYLLGLDAGRTGHPDPAPTGHPDGGSTGHSDAGGPDAGALTGPLRRAAVAGWVGSGLLPADHAALTPAGRDVLIDLGVAALERGLAAGRRRGTAPPSSWYEAADAAPDGAAPDGAGPDLADLVRALAGREAAVFQRTTCHPPPLDVVVETCPACGAGAGAGAAYLRTVEFGETRAGPSHGAHPSGGAWLRMLGCEALPVHALTMIADLRERRPLLTGEFVTRAAFLAGQGFRLDRLDPADALHAVDAAESRSDPRAGAVGGVPIRVLPVCTGPNPWAAGTAGGVAGAGPLGPHANGPGWTEITRAYTAHRDRLVADRLTELTQAGPAAGERLDARRLARPW
ncbi:hypothetical protein Sru01_28010 [Sphaerisporangium rufum]|uniref:Uncharacterized protein n=1 Tax=Sphaerisporangium rufum TaxID=1381558 RepID=A0A919UZJ5_9ACTN|nr:hypothetical protein [Sphaerisporangium rufum]GII77819.1 hypothetical protein Sru01_28010 [Sphaerisporangium rufum]